MKRTKSGLAIELSKLDTFSSPSPKLEQYPTDSEIAAEVLWFASMRGDIEGKTLADLGCGTGILGIGALLLGAKKVFFIDTDSRALDILKKNLKSLSITKGFRIIESDISEFDTKTDIVLENPPFGTKTDHADREFLVKAATTAPIIYSFHKTSTSGFVEAFAHDNNLRTTDRLRFDFPLKQTQAFHKSRIRRIDVTCFRLERSP